MKNSNLFNHELATKAEELGCLPDEWLTKVYSEKWFKLFVPKDLGGLGCTLPEALAIEEKLAELDGSLGWTVTLCAGAAWFAGFMDESLRKDIFHNEKLCLAGSGFVGGKADKIGENFLISGSWTYASGALHATHLTANCEILEDGKALLDKEGKSVIKAFVIDRKDAEILDGWNYMGMIATGSHAFRIENLSVPQNRCFEILPEKAQLKAPLYQYPFLQFAEVTLAANILGVSTHLIELIEQSFWKRNEYRKYDKKQLSYFQNLLNKQNKKLQKLRDEFYHKVNASWTELEENGKISDSRLKKISGISRKLTQKCREINGKLYPFSGLEAAKTYTELNRVWRDFNTVGQHALLIFPF